MGIRHIFHVLTRFGQGELAYEMITRPDYPGYGNMVAKGATSLWEGFDAPYRRSGIGWRWRLRTFSMNHCFFGEVNGWFVKRVAGLIINGDGGDIYNIDVKPDFIRKFSFAEAFREMPYGRVSVRWERINEKILLNVAVPEVCHGQITLPKGCIFENGLTERKLESGKYTLQYLP
jgi:alpha-L-rhamnosidase